MTLRHPLSVVRSPVRPVVGAAPAAGGYTVNAANFDGTNDYLHRSSAFTGGTPGQVGTASIWFKPVEPNFSAEQPLLTVGGQTSVVWTSAGELGVQIYTAAWALLCDFATTEVFPNDSIWRHILLSWDLSASKLLDFYVDDVSAPGALASAIVAGTVPYDTSPSSMMAATSGAFKIGGCVSEVYLDQTTYTDLSIIANRRKFIDANGYPVDLGPDGSTPSGSQPLIYLPNSYGTFEQNAGSGGDFTVIGALSNCGDTP